MVPGWIWRTARLRRHRLGADPLVVDPAQQGQGIGRGGRRRELESEVRGRGGVTIFLGSDDENGMTSLADVDLYPDVAGHIATIRNLKRHPFEFYQKQGYTIVGVIPDANGPGKPDIMMAKRIVPRKASEVYNPGGKSSAPAHRRRA